MRTLALSREPENRDAKTLHATILVRQGKEDESVALLEEILAAEAGHVGAASLLAAILEKQGKEDGALKVMESAVAANQERIAAVGGWVIAMVVVLNAAGYLAGWGLARLYGFDARHRLTLAIEIGMQNAGLGVALALKHFAPETALPGALFAVWCILTAAGASAWLRRHHLEPATESPGPLI